MGVFDVVFFSSFLLDIMSADEVFGGHEDKQSSLNNNNYNNNNIIIIITMLLSLYVTLSSSQGPRITQKQ